MKAWPEALQDSIVPGIVGGIAANAAVATRGRADSGSAVAALNAPMHIVYGNRAAAVEQFSLGHTLPGVLINTGAGIWWALVFEKLFGDAADRHGAAAALAGGLATAGLAYVVDYKLLPQRLTPGWESRISKRSLFMCLGAMGLGIGVGALLGRAR